MAVQIHSIGELEKLLRNLKIQVNSTEELRSLWETVTRPPHPEVARMEAIKLVGVAVPLIMAAVGVLASLILTAMAEDVSTNSRLPMVVGSMAIIWGTVAVVCVPTLVIVLALLYRLRLPETKPFPPADKPARTPGIIRSLELPVDEPPPAREPTPLSQRVTTGEGA
jgi:hypothetical protein